MTMRVSIITPSLNQAAYLERAIKSVITQGYPDIEYIVIDGGSTDGSVDVIRRYADRICWWISEPDNGQAHAINKGLYRATGDIVGWLNSDDSLAPGALNVIAESYARHPKVDLVYGHTCLIDKDDRVLRRLCAVPTNAYEITHYNRNLFSQPGTTWRRSLHDRIGYLDETLDYTMDCDFWIRAARSGVLYFCPQHLGNLRMYDQTKSSTAPDLFEQEHRLLDARYGNRLPSGLGRYGLTVRRYFRILTSPATLAYRWGWCDKGN